MTAAIFHHQARPTRSGRHRASQWAKRSKFGFREEIADLLKRSIIRQHEPQQAGNHFVETDQFRGAARAFYAKEDFGWILGVAHAEVERVLAGNPELLGDVVVEVGGGEALADDVCSSSEADGSVRGS